MIPLMTDTPQNTCFQSASKEVLRYLHERLGFSLWMVTRTEGRDWIVLQAEDHGYSVNAGDVFQWADSFCSRMVQGKGPRIAPRSCEVPAYAEAEIGNQVPIGAYIGVPLNREDGELFGTLCAIDPHPQSEEIADELNQIEMMARLLETILESEFKANQEARRAERAEAQAMSDSLTGLFNRRGWDRLIAAEEERCRKYAHPAVIVSLDLDDLKKTNDDVGHSSGDLLLQETARVLRENVRKQDIVARVGGDEFLILAIECSELGGSELVERLRKVLEAEGVMASLGFGFRKPAENLLDACLIADKTMYECKRQRKLVQTANPSL